MNAVNRSSRANRRSVSAIHRFQHGGDDDALDEKVARLEHLILAQRKKTNVDKAYCRGINEANRKSESDASENEEEAVKAGFSEFLHGKHFTPGGTHSMAWSAAAAILAEQYIAGKRLFSGK